jgi:hypothetical protein
MITLPCGPDDCQYESVLSTNRYAWLSRDDTDKSFTTRPHSLIIISPDPGLTLIFLRPRPGLPAGTGKLPGSSNR